MSHSPIATAIFFGLVFSSCGFLVGIHVGRQDEIYAIRHTDLTIFTGANAAYCSHDFIGLYRNPNFTPRMQP